MQEEMLVVVVVLLLMALRFAAAPGARAKRRTFTSSFWSATYSLTPLVPLDLFRVLQSCFCLASANGLSSLELWCWCCLFAAARSCDYCPASNQGQGP